MPQASTPHDVLRRLLESEAHARRRAEEAERVNAEEAQRLDEEIVDLAREIETDLIVMGHARRRPRTRLLLGSVAEHVLEFAPCPVLIVKYEDDRHAGR